MDSILEQHTIQPNSTKFAEDAAEMASIENS